MDSRIVKTLVFNKQVRLFFVNNTKLIQDILGMHKYKNHLLEMVLGKTVSAVSLLSGTLKGEQRLSVTISMSNPKYRVFADTDASGNVRRYLNRSFLSAKDIDHNSLKALIGDKASIRVIKGSNIKASSNSRFKTNGISIKGHPVCHFE